MKLEDLDRVLEYDGITVHKAARGGEIFERLRSFEINGQFFCVEWWANAMYLNAGGLTIPFSVVKKSNTWPHRSKMNFQFYNNAEVCAVLKIE